MGHFFFFFITACPDGWTRFGDNCFKALAEIQSDIEHNADSCADEGGLLWYPESGAEISFIEKTLAVDAGVSYHLGVKSYKASDGIVFIDGSISPGIPAYTCKFTSRIKNCENMPIYSI